MRTKENIETIVDKYIDFIYQIIHDLKDERNFDRRAINSDKIVNQ